jgi:hypothetical protein
MQKVLAKEPGQLQNAWVRRPGDQGGKLFLPVGISHLFYVFKMDLIKESGLCTRKQGKKKNAAVRVLPSIFQWNPSRPIKLHHVWWRARDKPAGNGEMEFIKDRDQL